MTGYAISNRPIRVSVATARRYTGLPPTYASPGEPGLQSHDKSSTASVYPTRRVIFVAWSSVSAKQSKEGLLPISAGQPHPSEADPTNTTLFIGGLGGTVSEEDLRAIFGQYGPIVYTKIPPGKGCGFVQFVQRPSAEAALLGLQGQVTSQPRMHAPSQK